jgi:hypothetical protein
MRRSFSGFAVATLLLAGSALAKDSEKGALPATVLRAKTVAILVDPDAGVSLTDPQANQVAQRDVEAAMANWGRFQPVLSTEGAELLIVVRRGHDKLVDETIHDPRQNNRPGSVTPSNDGIGIGVQHGRPPNPISPGNSDSDTHGGSQMEVGAVNDSFAVYQNQADDPLSRPAVWRYDTKGALKPHSVPAVEQFRKAIAVADKIAAKHP